MALVGETAVEAWELLRASEASSNFMTYGGGKAVLVAGFWWLLDPVTGVPVYAIAGENEDVHQAMNALGYSEATRDRGVAVHDAVMSALGYKTPKVLGVRRRPERNDVHGVGAGVKRYRGGSADDWRYEQLQDEKRAKQDYWYFDQESNSWKQHQPNMSANDVAMSGTSARSSNSSFIRKRLRQALSRVPRGVKNVKKPMRFVRVRRDICEWKIDAGTLKYQLGIMSGSMGGFVAGANGLNLSFTLDSLQNYAEITNLFDSYRIVKIVTTFIPLESAGGYEIGPSGSATGAVLQAVHPVLLYASDENDVTSGSESSLIQQENVRMTRLDKMFSYSFKPVPYVSDGLGRTKVLGGWCPANNPSVIHYGLKMNVLADTLWPVDGTNSTQAHRFLMMHKFVIEAKTVQ